MSILQETKQETKIENQVKQRTARNNAIPWRWVSLGGILFLSAILNLALLKADYYTNEYYSAAVRSMLQNWHNFFFNAYDPGGFITIDKPPVALWFQTASAWLVGYNGVSLILPSALAGVGSVALLYHMVSRYFGTIAGLASAFILAITPIFVVMSRHNNPESLLIFFMLVGAWALSRATAKGSIAWLSLSTAMIGVAFNIKMLEAFIVLPAFYLVYLLLAPVKWWKRIIHLVLSTIVLAAVSLSWAVAVDLTPADQRPYIGSSSTNSVLNLIFDYNGLNRIESQSTGNSNGNPPGGFNQPRGNQPPNGFQPPVNNGNVRPGNGGGMNGVIAGQAGPFRMFDSSLAGEAGWLLPLSLAGIVLAAIQYRRRFPAGQIRRQRYQNLLLWSGWLLTFMVVFSIAGGIFHSYYLVMLSPGIAALGGISLEALWYAYRKGSWQRLLLPVVFLATALFQFNILSMYSDWNRTLSLTVFGIELICVVALLALPALVRPLSNKLTNLITGVGFAGLCATPLAWSINAVLNKSYTNETLPTALPTGSNTSSGGINLLNNLLKNWNMWLTILIVALVSLVVMPLLVRFVFKNARILQTYGKALTIVALIIITSLGISLSFKALPPASANNTAPVSSGMIGNPTMELKATNQLLAYLEANRANSTYLLVTTSSQNASAIIINTGQPVMALGGFMGSDQTVTVQQFAQMVKNNEVRFVLLDSSGGIGRGNNSQSVTGWVQQNCSTISSQVWSSGTSATSQGQLYKCAA
ncbi:MAG: glycosyltransferase family 39 protein [Chloroflexi bacterium]|uniref:Glycosyltransferase family 39 protein n=1 Tax=Candidatus Chlorohelix allophototropha TaxID=3003348 RepID=A0A8T7LTV5_9CHLR|nr:glycosyltransferase family 39 protein [Chloroflexota bacterium]WJW66163.1 glycosyltransferase family 39 protein [Chloroflexota bacterium L227-S17]